MSEGYDASKLLAWLLGIFGGLITLGIVAAIGMLVSTGSRLTVLETSINENKDERRAQIQELRERISALEGERDE